MPGTATGIAAPISTTARRWARPERECQIDSHCANLGRALAGGESERGHGGDGAVDERLVRRDSG